MWDIDGFNEMLDASKVFSKLNSNFRANVEPELTVHQLESLTDEVENFINKTDFESAISGLIKGSVLYGHTGYLNQQLNFPISSSTIATLWTAILNQGHAVFNMSPISSIIEKRMLDWAKQRLKLPTKAFGLSTGGGSLANLSALIAARNKLDSWDTWNKGTNANSQIYILASNQTHYSISRSASMIGIGGDNVIAIGVDKTGGIDLDELGSILIKNKQKFIVCLTLGTTTSGAFDNITGFFDKFPNIDRENIWIHVDAAHGGSFYCCDKLEDSFSSLKFADSISWDLHKVYFQSLPLSFLFFKDKNSANYISKHETPYLTQEIYGEYPDMHNWTLECSRAGNSMKLWLSLHTYGEKFFTEKINHLAEMTRYLYEIFSNDKRIKIYNKPCTNVLCFKLNLFGLRCDENLTRKLFSVIETKESWSVGYVDIEGEFYIKICLMNPRIDEKLIRDFYLFIDKEINKIDTHGIYMSEEINNSKVC